MTLQSKKPLLLLLTLPLLLLISCKPPVGKDYYQVKIYRYASPGQEAMLDKYLEDAYLPALRRKGIGPVGVFKPRVECTDLQNATVLLIPFSSPGEFESLPGILAEDEKYLESGKEYIGAAHDNPPYSRIESILLRAFSGSPAINIPDYTTPGPERVYELRSYQAATEQLYERKVEMFNQGESELFRKLEFNPVFFGEVISSAHMPHLMYMTTFADTASQKEHWDAFRVHPDWEEMKVKERYQNTVSHIDKYLLYPTPYSDY